MKLHLHFNELTRIFVVLHYVQCTCIVQRLSLRKKKESDMQIFMTSPNLPICFHQVDKEKESIVAGKLQL